ncbi:hypothetical protein AAIB33_11800 [Microbacterium sp. AZCO]|uniref:hypothetical protein n=1 Tax=Microbacterium sp. AZCO TaxID=3142976 RepID=UPI0031F386FC
MTWSIDPAAARTVLDKAMDRVAEVDAAAEAHSSAIDAAQAAAPDGSATKAGLRIVVADPLMRGIAAARRYVLPVGHAARRDSTPRLGFVAHRLHDTARSVLRGTRARGAALRDAAFAAPP